VQRLRMKKPWDDDAGDWQGLASATQNPRYRTVAGVIGRFCGSGSILDVGCGEAVLWDYLPRGVNYLGIEPSAKAAQSAQAKCGPARIVHCTAEDFDSGERLWDCIVFNEVLYYTSNPLALLDKYSKLVRPGGIIIVSIYQKQRNGISARLSWALGREGSPNVECTRKVHGFMTRHGWLIDEDTLVPRPAGGHWRIWRVQPPRA